MAKEPGTPGLNEKVRQNEGSAPVESNAEGVPRRRTWEGYAEDFHALSKRLLDVSEAHQGAVREIAALQGNLAAKDGQLERVKKQRLKDLDRLAAVSRTRDLLEKRSASQMAKVAAALTRATPAALAPPPPPPSPPPPPVAALGFDGGATVPTPPPVVAPVAIGPVELYRFATDLGEASDRSLGWAERRWWRETIRVAQKAHREGQLAHAETAFELALRTKQTASLWEQAGHVLRENHKATAAYEAYQRSLRMQPDRAELIFLSGYCLEMMGRNADAVACYDDALSRDPSLADRYEHLRHYHARLAH